MCHRPGHSFEQHPSPVCCLGAVLRLGVVAWHLAFWCLVLFGWQVPWVFYLAGHVAWPLAAGLAGHLVSLHFVTDQLA